ncbi:MAG TPA: hypothetical protein VG713_02175 [Pirellulales bacterium]|nr:hypothetical protein [Pirellulales bacterium]
MRRKMFVLGFVAAMLLFGTTPSAQAARVRRNCYYCRPVARQPLTNFPEWWTSVTTFHRGGMFH